MSIVLYFFVRKIPLEAVAIGDSLDWKDLSATEIAERVTTKVKPGSICLFHNAALHTPEALPIIIEALQQEGYKIVPISELILTKDYTIDHSGMQIPNKTSGDETKTAAPKTDNTNSADSTKPAETEKNTDKASQPTSASTDIIVHSKPLSDFSERGHFINPANLLP